MISEKNRLFVGDEERRGKRGERSVARKGVFVRSTRLTPMGWRLGSIEKQKLWSFLPSRVVSASFRCDGGRLVESDGASEGRGERLAQTRINGVTA